ncbi:MAG: winged helix-turn-helix domain-containing protein [Acidobacteriaceae bacterium]|nr:winged helix-turn-helix domain-containing protein [Acidobacteriaceae bacterium]
MKEGPDIARIGTLIGDPARANMLTALIGGKALTATELSQAAGVTLQTASTHLSKLEDGGLIVQRKQGRHRYFTLADAATGALLETIMGFAASRGHLRYRPGPKDPALRKARVCYDHLAGDFGVRMLDSFVCRGEIETDGENLSVTPKGYAQFEAFGIDLSRLASNRRPLCKSCLDWSERRSHLAGTLGKALLSRMFDQGWARRSDDSRAVLFTPKASENSCCNFRSAPHN